MLCRDLTVGYVKWSHSLIQTFQKKWLATVEAHSPCGSKKQEEHCGSVALQNDLLVLQEKEQCGETILKSGGTSSLKGNN